MSDAGEAGDARGEPGLSEGDQRELLRIARVYAREWLRSGRRPPGVPHRASLLAPAAGWMRLHGPVDERAAARLTSDRAVYSAIAELAVQLVQQSPRLAPEELAASRFEIVVVNAWTRVTDPAWVVPGRHHILVSTDAACALLSASETGGHGNGLAAVQAACARAGLGEDAWQDAGVRVDAAPGDRFADPSPTPSAAPPG